MSDHPTQPAGDVRQVAVIGAGIIGLCSALWLQRAGHRVTLIDQAQPGLGTSFGNAGLFADYARLPFTSFSLLCKMPAMLLDAQSPVSVQPSYLPQLMPYGWHFFKACFPSRYRRGKQALTALQELAPAADRSLQALTGTESLVQSHGCLGLFSSTEGFAQARTQGLRERREQGVELEFLSATQVQQLEPNLNGFHAGGVYYPRTRHTVSPVALSRALFTHFCDQGGRFVQQKVDSIHADADAVELRCGLQQLQFDRLVIATGAASKALADQCGVRVPLVSERGYHLTLDLPSDTLTRPVGWLDQGIFLTPMRDGIRVAGTAEFAACQAPPDARRSALMHTHADRMLGRHTQVKSSWMGSRPSTPDSLPVIGTLKAQPRVTLAFGHGHLGLTLAAITGQLVCQLISDQPTDIDLSPFAPERFA